MLNFKQFIFNTVLIIYFMHSGCKKVLKTATLVEFQVAPQ